MDINEIKRTLEIFRTDNGLHEVRVINMLNGGENYSAIFDNDDDLISEVSKYDKDPYNVYFIFNELKDATRGMVQLNHFVKKAPTIKDTNIKYLRWLMVDLDPIREGGVKDVSSSEDEFENAHRRMIEVYRHFKEIGFKEPVICKSGNGYHAMYRLDNIAPSKENTDYIRDFFNYMSLRFTDELVDFDIKNSNAARLTKLYSTTARKGGNTPDRPHRASQIIKVPDIIEACDFNLVIEYARRYREIESEDPNQNIRRPTEGNFERKRFDIDEFLSKNHIEVLRETRYGTSRKIILKECPFHPEHGKDSAIFVSESGAISFTCFHSGCSGNNWKTLRLKFDPTAYDRPQYEPKWQGGGQGFNRPNEWAKKKQYEIKEELPELGEKWLSMSSIKKIDLSQLEKVTTGFHEIDSKIVGLYMSEVTVLSGSNSSGKSSWLNTLILNIIQQNYKVALWSGELRADILKTWIQMVAAGKDNLRKSQYGDGKYFVPDSVGAKIDAWLDGKFFLYNNEYGVKWEQIFNDMAELLKAGVKIFVLDNLFSLDIDLFDGDKNNKQRELILQIKDFATKKQVHIILVAHPRKVMTFLRKNDISGTSDITNAVDNVFIMHRVNNDFNRAVAEFFDNATAARYASFGNVLAIEKNRMYGATDVMCGLQYEIESRRFKNYIDERIIYGWEHDTQPMTLGMEQYGNNDDFADNDFDNYNPFASDYGSPF